MAPYWGGITHPDNGPCCCSCDISIEFCVHGFRGSGLSGEDGELINKWQGTHFAMWANVHLEVGKTHTHTHTRARTHTHTLASANREKTHSLLPSRWHSGKESVCQCRRYRRRSFNPWVGKIPWSRKWHSHSSILAWKIPWTEDPGGLQSMKRVRHDWAAEYTRAHTHTLLKTSCPHSSNVWIEELQS